MGLAPPPYVSTGRWVGGKGLATRERRTRYSSSTSSLSGSSPSSQDPKAKTKHADKMPWQSKKHTTNDATSDADDQRFTEGTRTEVLMTARHSKSNAKTKSLVCCSSAHVHTPGRQWCCKVSRRQSPLRSESSRTNFRRNSS